MQLPIVVTSAIVAGALALALTLWQGPMYEARADVLFSRVSVQASLTGVPNSVTYADAASMASVQSYLSRLRHVVSATLREVGQRPTDRAAHAFLESSRIEVLPASPEVLAYLVQDRKRGRVVPLVNAWAREGTRYRKYLDTRALRTAADDTMLRIRQLERTNNDDSDLYRSMVDKEQQLRTTIALQAGNGTVIRPAGEAYRVGRSPLRATLLGLAAGAILGLALIYIRTLFDIAPQNENVDVWESGEEASKEFVR